MSAVAFLVVVVVDDGGGGVGGSGGSISLSMGSQDSFVVIITGVQASGGIIDRLLRQCCFVWSAIVGLHSSGNFNDNNQCSSIK